MAGECIWSFLTLIGTVSITEDGNGRITGVYLPNSNLPPMDECETDALKDAASQINKYLAGKRTEFDIDVVYDVSDFRARVMKSISDIPYGEVRTYGEIAKAIGSPNSVRAVGTACRENPLPIIIPCHRVVPSSGGYGNYSGGASMKRRLLEIEGVRLDRLQKDPSGERRTGVCRILVQAHPWEGEHNRRQDT